MNASVMVVWGIAAVLLAYARLKKPEAIDPAFRFAVKQAAKLSLRLPLALLTAGFLSELVPGQAVASLIGETTGLGGVIVASVLGGLLPGGPMVSFPLAIFLWREGAGPAQLVALLAGWSVFAMHRMIAYELPMMGARFCAVRLGSSWMLPPLAGLLAAGLFALSGFKPSP